jgi:hypothetical protein
MTEFINCNRVSKKPLTGTVSNKETHIVRLVATVLLIGGIGSSLPAQAQADVVWLRCDITWTGQQDSFNTINFYAMDAQNDRVGRYWTRYSNKGTVSWSQAVFDPTSVRWVLGDTTDIIDRQTLSYSEHGSPGNGGYDGKGSCHKVASPTAENQF